MTTFNNLKPYLPSALKQPKTLDGLDGFDLTLFRNCPIRIEILPVAIYLNCFYDRLVPYVFILYLVTSCGQIFGIKCQPVIKTIYIYMATSNYFLIQLTLLKQLS